MNEYLDNLNEPQRNAVEYCDGPSLVIAGAGSGKTRVLTYKIVYLLEQGYEPYRILALTFTNKAAREMKERIASLIGPDKASQLWMGTFHSIFSRILRMNADKIGFKKDFTIYDSNDSKSVIKMIVKDMDLDDKIYKPSSIQSHISNMKNALISPQDYELDKELRQADSRAKRPLMFAVYKAYWNRCFVAGAMDFDDLLFYTNVLLRDNPDVLLRYQEHFKYVLVDEYQDTNFAQHLIVSQLCRIHEKLCVVGDDAQSIYSFRGANITNILNLSKSYPKLKTFKLEQNYRSTQNIIDAANSLIDKNKHQIRKHIFSTNNKGNKISVIQSYSDYEEGYVVASQIISTKALNGDSYEDFAVLYRTNAQSRILEEALRKRNVPYRIYGGLSFYQRKEIKDAISYFRLTVNPNDDEALKRVINYPSRGIGDTTLSKIQQSAIKNNVSMWTVICDASKFDLAVNGGTLKKLDGFRAIIEHFIKMNDDGANAFEISQTILKESKLLALVQSDNTPENISKQENLSELINGVNDFVSGKQEAGNDDISLTNFLAEVSLATDQDKESNDNNGECVTMMTVHAAKGLEFKNVIIVGVEEDLFPSSMSNDSIAAIEEERRLLYVAITRAKSTCAITYATSRYKNGQINSCAPSRFIKDIDSQYLSLSQTASSSGSESFVNPNYNRRQSIFGNEPSWGSERYDRDVKSSSLSHSRPIPRTTMKSVPTTQNSASGGDYKTHTIDEIAEGMKIKHSRFGLGEISHIDISGSDAKMTADFGAIGVKILLLKFAKFIIVDNNAE